MRFTELAWTVHHKTTHAKQIHKSHPPHRTMSKVCWPDRRWQCKQSWHQTCQGVWTREPALPGRRKSPPWWSLCSQAPYLCHITIFTHTNIIIQLLVGHKLIFVHTQYGWLWIWMFVDDCKFPSLSETTKYHFACFTVQNMSQTSQWNPSDTPRVFAN